MKQGIEKIMDFVTITIHPKNIVRLDLSETGLKTLLDTASIEIETIRKHLMTTLFDLQRQNELESLVQNYQSFIIKLLNDLFKYRQGQTEDDNLISLYISLSDLLFNILTYIETYFVRYFNFDEEIPHLYYSSNSKEFKQQLSEWTTHFKGKSADLELIEIISLYYQLPFTSSNKKPFTYRDLFYRNELLRELNTLVSDSSIYKSVRAVLLYLNFNHVEFFKYLIDKLQEEYNKFETLETKLEFLKYQRKQFRQMMTQTKFALFSEFTSIKEQVVNWVQEEILFIESQIKPVDQEPEEKDIEPVSESKISVALSVAQLAFFIRVLSLGKIITNNNQSDVIRFFASNFKTIKTEEISYGSLLGKYFKPDAFAIKQVKSVLLQLAGLITKFNE